MQYNDSYINMIESRYLMFRSDISLMYQVLKEIFFTRTLFKILKTAKMKLLLLCFI
jgi:hypothetical protein